MKTKAQVLEEYSMRDINEYSVVDVETKDNRVLSYHNVSNMRFNRETKMLMFDSENRLVEVLHGEVLRKVGIPRKI